MTGGPQAPSVSRGYPIRFVLPLLLGAAVNPINTSSIAVALEPIRKDLGLSVAQATSLVGLLYLASAVAQPMMGKLAVVFGARKTFLTGLLIALAGAIVGATAAGYAPLVVARLLIGIGSSAGFPTAMVILRQRADKYGGPVPSAVLAALTIASQVTAAIGLPLGGLAVALVGWRGTFLLNVPICLWAVWAAYAGLPDARPGADEDRGVTARRLDLVGGALLALGLAALILFLLEPAQPQWTLLAFAGACIAGFCGWEMRASEPLVDVRLIARTKPLAVALIRNLLGMTVFYAVLYGVSQWLEGARGLNAATVGLLMLPISVVGSAASFLGSRGIKIRRQLIIAGAAAAASGIVVIALSGGQMPLWCACVAAALTGLTMGYGTYANQFVVFRVTPAHAIGTASGLYRTFTYLGAIGSSAVVTLALGSAAKSVGLAFLGGAVVLLGAALVTLSFGRTAELDSRS